MKLSKTQTAAIALTIANIIWGAAPPIFKWSLESIPLFTLGFLRFIIPCILILLFYRKSLRIKPRDWLIMFLVGFNVITVNILFFFLGLKLAPSINATMIGSAGPIFLIIGSFLFLREKIKTKTIIGNVLGFIGMLVIVFEPLVIDGKISFFGNLFYILSTIGIVVGTIFAKKIVKKYNPITLTFWSLFIGAATFFPFFLQEAMHENWRMLLTFQALTGIEFGSILSSLTAYYLFFVSLKYFPASETGIYMYVDPVVTFMIAIPLLHEIPNAPFIVGSILIFLGIYIAEKRISWHPIDKLFRK